MAGSSGSVGSSTGRTIRPDRLAGAPLADDGPRLVTSEEEPMRGAVRFAGLLTLLLSIPPAPAQEVVHLGVFLGGAGTVAGDGVGSPGLAWGLAGQYRPGAVSVVAVELRIGSRSYASTEWGGPQYRDFDHDQVPVSIGAKLFLAPRSRHPVYLSVGGTAAPGRTTVTQHFRPFPQPVPDQVTEESGVAFGGFAGAGVDLRVSERLVLVLDLRLEYQAGAESGDPHAAFLGGTAALAYRFPAAAP